MIRFSRFFIVLFLTLGSALITSCGDEASERSGPITISIPEDYLFTSEMEEEEVWFFITNKDGHLLGVQQGDNNTMLTFDTPSGQGIVLHQLNYLSYTDNTYSSVSVVSYTNITPGDFQLKPKSNSPWEKIIGSHEVTFNNLDAAFNTFTAPGDDFITQVLFTGYLPTRTFIVEQTKEGIDQLYCFSKSTNRNVVPRFKKFTNVNVGDVITADFVGFTEMTTSNLNLGLTYDELFATISFFPDDTRHLFSTIDKHYLFNTNSAKLYYPGNLYDDYLTRLSLKKDGTSFTYQKIGSIPASVKTLDASITGITQEGNDVNFASTGNYDYIRVSGGELWSTETAEHDIFWEVYIDGANNKSFKIPAFPEEILIKYPELSATTINFNYVSATDFDDINGYNDYLHVQLETNESLYKHFTETLSIGVNFSTNGRKSRAQKKFMEQGFF